MRAAINALNKGNDDVKPKGQTHASGTGHHMKTTDKKRKYDIFFLLFINCVILGWVDVG
jgi:hypothetical protein